MGWIEPQLNAALYRRERSRMMVDTAAHRLDSFAWMCVNGTCHFIILRYIRSRPVRPAHRRLSGINVQHLVHAAAAAVAWLAAVGRFYLLFQMLMNRVRKMRKPYKKKAAKPPVIWRAAISLPSPFSFLYFLAFFNVLGKSTLGADLSYLKILLFLPFFVLVVWVFFSSLPHGLKMITAHFNCTV
jgi:hypothetical protein